MKNFKECDILTKLKEVFYMNINKLTYEDVDGYIVLSEFNRYYFTDFHSSFGILIATKDKGYYITDNRYGEVCRAHFAGTEVEALIATSGKDAYDIAKKIVSDNGIKTLGFEDVMSVREFEELKEQIPATYVAKGVYFEILRSIKTDEEVEKIATIMEISSRAFEKALSSFKVGMTEKELCAELNYQIYNLGADSLAFETIVASGTNGSKPHAVPSDKRVEKGEMVTFDFGGRLNGYCADITRTIAFGKISDEQEKLYNTVKEAQLIGLSAVKVGAMGCEIDGTVREFFKSKGLDKYFIHSLGHGVGVEIHELPRLANGFTTELCENMIVTVEPGLYIPDKYGVRIEDTVCVGKNGIRNLAKISKELITIKA